MTTLSGNVRTGGVFILHIQTVVSGPSGTSECGELRQQLLHSVCVGLLFLRFSVCILIYVAFFPCVLCVCICVLVSVF